MKVTPFVIEKFSAFLLGSNVFARIKGVVERQNDKDLSGVEKRHAAISEIKTIGLEIATWAINVGIELAVVYLRAKSGFSAK